MDSNLIKKYNAAVPRYTSYPTVPHWGREALTSEEWKGEVQSSYLNLPGSGGLSLYIHLPYCESLCTYCGCNKRITKNHNVESPYIDGLLKEWDFYLDIIGPNPRISEIHLGGGTPTFFSADNLAYLVRRILDNAQLTQPHILSFEGHPDNTAEEHLRRLADQGFTRLSLGIQDFDLKVQEMINRYQSFDQVYCIMNHARKSGYSSINFDLVYGLPLQTEQSIMDTFEKVISLKPERIALYSYAHIPWKSAGQRKFSENDLPRGEDKLNLYLLGKRMLEIAGYRNIGMDHFALERDELLIASENGSLHRNFMGYTTRKTDLLIGLGVSAISDASSAYVQNLKSVEAYLESVNQNEFLFDKGCILSSEDMIIKTHISNLICRYETTWLEIKDQCAALDDGLNRLADMAVDGLVWISPHKLVVTEKGKPFIRNVCSALDTHLWKSSSSQESFSSSI